MVIHDVVAEAQRRKREQAVANELELRNEKRKDETFAALRVNVVGEFRSQVGVLQQHPETNKVLLKNRDANSFLVYRKDSAKTLTVLFSENYHTVTFSYDGGSVLKHTLAVELDNGQPFYRFDGAEVVQPTIDGLQSVISRTLDTLLQ